MGLLALGTPLPWAEAKQHADYVREHGIEQFLKIWHRLKDRTGDVLLWGDEVRSYRLRVHRAGQLIVGLSLRRASAGPPFVPQIEYMVISYDDENKNARLSLRQTEILVDLQQDAERRMKEMPGRECVFAPQEP